MVLFTPLMNLVLFMVISASGGGILNLAAMTRCSGEGNGGAKQLLADPPQQAWDQVDDPKEEGMSSRDCSLGDACGPHFSAFFPAYSGRACAKSQRGGATGVGKGLVRCKPPPTTTTTSTSGTPRYLPRLKIFGFPKGAP